MQSGILDIGLLVSVYCIKLSGFVSYLGFWVVIRPLQLRKTLE